MIILVCALLIIALAAVMLGGGSGGALDRVEQLFLWMSPLPTILALVLPGVLALSRPAGTQQVPWYVGLDVAGGILSLVLLIAGVLLLLRRSRRQQPRDSRLSMGLIVAGLPAVLIGLVALLYLL